MELYFESSSETLHFTNPLRVLIAYDDEQAAQAMQLANQALTQGCIIAGFLSYELGYGYVDLPRPHHTQPFWQTHDSAMPLLALGIFKTVEQIAKHSTSSSPRNAGITTALQPRISFIEYTAAFQRIQEMLFQGMVYQVNLSVPFDFTFYGDPLTMYKQLAASSRTNHHAYIRLGDLAVASISPELFLRFDGRTLTTKPMKGTASHDVLQDLHNAKNRAEHLMIVDLLRNDLSRVCTNVTVERLFSPERYPTFATMTSTISGKLQASATFTNIIAALFPCGSITGAPKRSAMKMISELERAPRGIYCGSIGYLRPENIGEWNVAIRTLQCDMRSNAGRLDLGGGIVAESRAEAEWDELLLKGRFLEQGLGDQNG